MNERKRSLKVTFSFIHYGPSQCYKVNIEILLNGRIDQTRRNWLKTLTLSKGEKVLLSVNVDEIRHLPWVDSLNLKKH